MRTKHWQLIFSPKGGGDLFAILLTTAETQVFANGIMGIVDFLTATAGLQIDLDTDWHIHAERGDRWGRHPGGSENPQDIMEITEENQKKSEG